MSTATAPTRTATIDELAAALGAAVGHSVSVEDLEVACWSRHIKVTPMGAGAGGRTVFAVDDAAWSQFCEAVK
jgi:hypothetical protein